MAEKKNLFIHPDFMLEGDRAQRLFHEAAAPMPIIDYHCHLPPQEIAEDKRWENITQVWLYGDHYKWRTMRSNGIDEHFCTGDANDREKFRKFAETMPYLLRNPMYHWSHLELARYFDIDDLLLSPATADEIWERTGEKLQAPEMSARGLMQQSRVRLVCTTDDPADDLKHHRTLAVDKDFKVRVLPTWRPDKALAIDRLQFWNRWTDRLGEVCNLDINSFECFMDALRQRHDFFHESGCRLSDYGIETVYAAPYEEKNIRAIFLKARSGKELDAEEVLLFRSAMLYNFGRLDASRDWTWQIHYGALRNNNRRLFDALGPDSGFDSIGDWPVAEALASLLGRLDAEDSLPRTILYTLNPRDNEVLASMLGNFQRGPTPGKIQFGSGWWFNDQKDGMERHIEALSQMGLLSRFVGMLTDSRSFLSYTRHEYFRRILCNILGSDMEKGLIPDDFDLVSGMVRDICYHNAVRYFGFALPALG